MFRHIVVCLALASTYVMAHGGGMNNMGGGHANYGWNNGGMNGGMSGNMGNMGGNSMLMQLMSQMGMGGNMMGNSMGNNGNMMNNGMGNNGMMNNMMGMLLQLIMSGQNNMGGRQGQDSSESSESSDSMSKDDMKKLEEAMKKEFAMEVAQFTIAYQEYMKTMEEFKMSVDNLCLGVEAAYEYGKRNNQTEDAAMTEKLENLGERLESLDSRDARLEELIKVLGTDEILFGEGFFKVAVSVCKTGKDYETAYNKMERIEKGEKACECDKH